MMRHLYDPTQYEFLKPLAGLNQLITAAAFVLFLAQLVFIANVAWSLKYGRIAEADPWKANTLEWTTPSPPPHGNWPGPLPEVEAGPYEYGPGAEDRRPQASPRHTMPAGAQGA
jgi:cytochrome c oxidase subunit 1